MDVITAITKERGRLRIVVNEDSEVENVFITNIKLVEKA